MIDKIMSKKDEICIIAAVIIIITLGVQAVRLVKDFMTTFQR